MRISMNVHARDANAAGSQDAGSQALGFGLRWATLALLCAFAAGCATTNTDLASAPSGANADRLAAITAIAGKPVSSFRYMGQSNFEPIGLSDLLVYTGPSQAWLLHLDGECRDLDFGPFLKLTSHMHRVSTLTDSVIVHDNPIPCQIEEIRPVDVAALNGIKPVAQPQDHVQVQTTIGSHPG